MAYKKETQVMSPQTINGKKRPSIERRWSASKQSQLATGRFDKMNRIVAAADLAAPSTSNPPASVPVIDISSFTSESPNSNLQVKCVEEVLSACLDTGFFKIKGHNVQQTTIDDMILRSRTFFSRPSELKEMAADPNNAAHGYFAKENINAALGRQGAADIREGYAIGPSNCDFFNNIWPDPDFQAVAEDYYKDMERLEKILSIIFSRALKTASGVDLTDDWMTTGTGRHRGLLRLNHYPNSSGTFGAHTDWSTFTILLPSGPGLEVIQEGQWHQVSFDSNDNCFVINCGDMIERWSNGVFKSNVHRVNCSAVPEELSLDKSRISISYFAAEIVDQTDESVVKPVIREGEQRAFETDLSILDHMTSNFEGMTGKSYMAREEKKEDGETK